MLKVEGLTKKQEFGGIENITFEVPKNKTFVMVGSETSGTTTLLETIVNVIPHDEGSIYFNGTLFHHITKELKNKIGYLPRNIDLYPEATVKEMLEYSASFYSGDLSRRIWYLVRRLDLNLTTMVKALTKEDLKKLGFIIAIMHEPDMMILDDVTKDLSPMMQDVICELLEEEKEYGATLLLATDNLAIAKRLGDQIGLLKEGHLMKIIDKEKLEQQNMVRVTLVSSEYMKLKLPLKDVTIEERTNSMLKFLYTGDMDTFIHMLSHIHVESLRVEDASLEEVFLKA